MLSKKIGMLFTFLDSALLPQLLNGLYGKGGDGMSLREEQCKKVCRILDDALANRPTERDSLIVAVQLAFNSLHEPHWIPVTERLPETTDAVLTTYIVNGDMSRRYVEESSYYGSDESWCSPWDEYRDVGTSIDVIAWMPMPEPYKGVTE